MFLNAPFFSPVMERKAWATITYAVSLALTLLLLFLQDPDQRLAAAALILLDLVSLLILLAREEEWDATHWLGLGYLLLSCVFALLYLVTPTTGVSYLLGAAIILAALVLFVVELVAGWRSYPFLGRLSGHAPRDTAPAMTENDSGETDEIVIESVKPRRKAYGLATERGAKVYHRDTCRLLAKKDGVVPLSSAEEAQSYGLKPCRFCKP